VATLVTSFDDAVDKFFGDQNTWTWTNSYAAFALAAFFQNSGARAYVVREVPTDAVKASCTIESVGKAASFVGRTLASTIDLSTLSNVNIDLDNGGPAEFSVAGAVPASTTPAEIVAAINTGLLATVASLVTDTDGNTRIKMLSTTVGASSELEFLPTTLSPADDAVYEVFGLALGGTYTYTGLDATTLWSITAFSEGLWGNGVKFVIEGDENYVIASTAPANGGSWTKFQVRVQEEATLGAGDYVVEEQYGPVDLQNNTYPDYIEDVVNASSTRVVLAETATGVPWPLQAVQWTSQWAAEGDGILLLISGTLYNPIVVRGTLSFTDGVETFTDNGDGTLTGDAAGTGTIDYNTGAFALTFNAAPGAATAIEATYRQQSSATTAECSLAGGIEGTSANFGRSQVSDVALQSTNRGIYAMDTIQDVINVSLPDFAGTVSVAGDLISWAEAQKNRFIILDPPIAQTPQEVLDWKRFTLNPNTSYAALYWPWIDAPDASTDGLDRRVPPSGHVAGAYARTDQEANVSWAPAGITRGKLNFLTGLEYDATKGERDILSPAQINALVDTPQTGRAIWDNLSLSLTTAWLELQVRRLFMFVEQSVFLSTFWAVFENNGPDLWGRLRLSLNGFLTNLHNDGYFGGDTPEQSFRVVCDDTNNPSTNGVLDNPNLVTVDVWILPNHAARWVRVRFQQITGQNP
jgi:phage tail sheath protein FI